MVRWKRLTDDDSNSVCMGEGGVPAEPQHVENRSLLTLFTSAAACSAALLLTAGAAFADSSDGWRNALVPDGREGAPITLATDGHTEYRIVIPQASTTMEQKAADDLALWLYEMTGASFPVVSDSESPLPKEISVGRTDRIPEGLQDGDLGPHGISIGQDGTRLLIQGGDGRGIINAVYALLEEDLGCRWYAENAPPRIPSRPDLTFAPVLRTYVPALRYRDPFYTVAFDVNWAIRNRTTPGIPIHASAEDRTFVRIPAEWGGSMYWAGRWVHTLPQTLLPAETYFEEHPEWYRVNAEGIRDTYQMSETHPEAMKEVVKNVQALLDEHPYANLVSISKNDGVDWTSETDRWLVDEEGANIASTLNLANRVAETLEKTHSHVNVTCLAYAGALDPPRTLRPRHNVAIRLCNSPSFNHVLLPAREDAGYSDITKRWSAIAPKLYIWDYVVDFGRYPIPMPNFHVIADNIRFHVENNAEGIMLQANYQGRSGGREHMKAWVSAKLLWNPDLNLDELIKDFTYGFYGKAASHIMDYNRMMRRFGEANRHMGGQLGAGMNLGLFTKEWLSQADGYLEKAEVAAENDEIRLRVQTVQLGPMFVKLTKGPEWTGVDEYRALIDRFVTIAEKAGADRMSEGGPDFEGYRERWRKMYEEASPE